MGCATWSWSGSQRVNEEGPVLVIISKGSRFFSDNFFEG